jgi:hypothetical protein
MFCLCWYAFFGLQSSKRKTNKNKNKIQLFTSNGDKTEISVFLEKDNAFISSLQTEQVEKQRQRCVSKCDELKQMIKGIQNEISTTKSTDQLSVLSKTLRNARQIQISFTK